MILYVFVVMICISQLPRQPRRLQRVIGTRICSDTVAFFIGHIKRDRQSRVWDLSKRRRRICEISIFIRNVPRQNDCKFITLTAHIEIKNVVIAIGYISRVQGPAGPFHLYLVFQTQMETDQRNRLLRQTDDWCVHYPSSCTQPYVCLTSSIVVGFFNVL